MNAENNHQASRTELENFQGANPFISCPTPTERRLHRVRRAILKKLQMRIMAETCFSALKGDWLKTALPRE